MVGTCTRKWDDRRERGWGLMGRGGLPCGARDARAQGAAGTGIFPEGLPQGHLGPLTVVLLVHRAPPKPALLPPTASFPTWRLSPIDTLLALNGLQQL